MVKYFYFVTFNPMSRVDEEGNARGLDDPSDLAGQTRELARQLKREFSGLSGRLFICKFDRKPPYKFLGVVS